MGGLTSLEIVGVNGAFWERVCTGSTSKSLQTYPKFTALAHPRPRCIRNRSIDVLLTNRDAVRVFVSRCSATIQTLQLGWTSRDPFKSLPGGVIYPQLSHLYLIPAIMADVALIQSFLKLTPALRHFRWPTLFTPEFAIPPDPFPSSYHHIYSCRY